MSDPRIFTEQQFYERISPFARDGRAIPRPGTNPHKGSRVNTKYSRYRQKCITEGRCPHCGKPCAPFFECPQRRVNKLFNRNLREMVKRGEIKVVSERPGCPTIYTKEQ
jgi:hypothetical protein